MVELVAGEFDFSLLEAPLAHPAEALEFSMFSVGG